MLEYLRTLLWSKHVIFHRMLQVRMYDPDTVYKILLKPQSGSYKHSSLFYVLRRTCIFLSDTKSLRLPCLLAFLINDEKCR